MSNKLSEALLVDVAIDNADITTARTSVYYDASLFRKGFARFKTGTVAQTKIATLEFLQATNSSGAGAKLLGDRQTFTAPTGGAVTDVKVDVDFDLLDTANGFTHVAVMVDSDNATAVAGAVALVLGDANYKPVAY